MKHTNESSAGAARTKTYGAGRAETMPGNGPNSMPPAAQRVDPSVRLGELKGEPAGSVPMETQMRKPQAYQAKRGAP